MNDDWIYIGADIYDQQWSKVGMTTRGLHTRHTSSQRPGYFIFTAYNIKSGDVHGIESHLLDHLECTLGIVRQNHYSTGSKSECFLLAPLEMSEIVEAFIERHYPSCVYYDTLANDISRYQCDSDVFRAFNPNIITPIDLSGWEGISQNPIPDNLSLNKNKYFTGNQVEHEVDLGNGYFLDIASGRQFYRDEEGNEY